MSFLISQIILDSYSPRVRGFPGGTSGKECACQCWRHKRHRVQSLYQEDPLEKGMATHSSILAWESHGQAIVHGSQKAGHD